MSELPHLPVWRLGRAYASLETSQVRDHRTGEVRAEVSTVNAGMIRKDLQRIGAARESLGRFTVRELVSRCARAGAEFLEGTLPLGDRGHRQGPRDYVETLSCTSGLPHNMIRRNMEKIHYALTHMEEVLRGLTRGMDLGVIDAGHGEQGGARVGLCPTTRALGLVMPSNSPAVNSLWLPAIALKTPVVLKPGKDEPWTPYRLIQAFVAAGVPAEAFGFYPCDHEGAAEILRQCGRALIFGDKATTAQYAGNPAVQVHGPGFSKILIGADRVSDWRSYLDLMVASIADNGGRSCINASAIVVPSHGREIAEALAARLGPVVPARADDADARLSGFANPKMAASIDAAIEQDLTVPGAEEVTARIRGGARRVEHEGGTYLRPTIVRCDSFAHPLANREFLFPYASVVEVAQEAMLEQIGPSLVVTAITRDPAFRRALLQCPWIDRLNLGAIPTTRIAWDQPHEGNLFEFLWRRRSLELGE